MQQCPRSSCQCSVGNKEPFLPQSITSALSKTCVLAMALIGGRSSSLAGMTLCSWVPAVGARASAPCGLVCCAKKPLLHSHQLWPEAGNFQPLYHNFSLNHGLSSGLAPIPNSHLGTTELALSCICCQWTPRPHFTWLKNNISFMSLKFAFSDCFQGASPHSSTMRQAS